MSNQNAAIAVNRNEVNMAIDVCVEIVFRTIERIKGPTAGRVRLNIESLTEADFINAAHCAREHGETVRGAISPIPTYRMIHDEIAARSK